MTHAGEYAENLPVQMLSNALKEGKIGLRERLNDTTNSGQTMFETFELWHRYQRCSRILGGDNVLMALMIS